MGLDGFSMGNLGLNADLTSAQMANQAEQLAQKEAEFKIKNISELSEQRGVARKKEDESGGKNHFKDGFRKKKNEDDENKQQKVLSEKDFENKDPREFSVRINPETELVELFNNKDEKILQTITAKDLMSLISKLDNASGVLVNRKI